MFGKSWAILISVFFPKKSWDFLLPAWTVINILPAQAPGALPLVVDLKVLENAVPVNKQTLSMFYHRLFRGFFMVISCHILTDGGFHGYTLTPTAPPSLRPSPQQHRAQLQDLSQLCTIDQLRMVPRQGREAHIHMGGKCHVQATPPWRIWMLLQLLRIMIHFVEMGKIIFEKNCRSFYLRHLGFEVGLASWPMHWVSSVWSPFVATSPLLSRLHPFQEMISIYKNI